MVVVTVPKDEKKEELLDSLMEHLEELKGEASELRKKGYDTKIADLKMTDVPSYVKLARATYEKKDIDKVKRQLAEIRHELDLIKEGTEFDAALEKLQEAFDLYREGKRRDAQEKYQELTKIYKNLPEDLRKTLYKASYDIHAKLRQ